MMSIMIYHNGVAVTNDIERLSSLDDISVASDVGCSNSSNGFWGLVWRGVIVKFFDITVAIPVGYSIRLTVVQPLMMANISVA